MCFILHNNKLFTSINVQKSSTLCHLKILNVLTEILNVCYQLWVLSLFKLKIHICVSLMQLSPTDYSKTRQEKDCITK